MQLNEIITQFELQVNDVTELSTVEEEILANRVYQRICSQKPWEFLRTSATGSVLTSNGTYYIPLEDDFAFFAENNEYTNNATPIYNNASPKVVFIGPYYAAYQIINYSDRRQYLNKNGYAYLDMANNQLVFTYQPDYMTYEYDYIKFPAVLTSADEPIFPERFQDAIVYGMATENDILQLSEKARSYETENNALYNSTLSDMSYWNAQLLVN